MLCTHCKLEFDEKLNVPRLLVVCGHSLCENCCYRLHLSNRVQCPTCHASTFIDSISLLPKNLALITQPLHHELCSRHMKKYEAFCEKENQLICIECILQDGHKNHEMDSIRNCHERHREKWARKVEKLEKCALKMGETMLENQKNQEEFRELYSVVRESASSFFKEIRDILDKEEDAVMTKFREVYTQSDAKFDEKINLVSNLTNEISQSLIAFKSYQNYSEVQFLQSHSTRENQYNAISQQGEQIYKAPALSFAKKGVVENLGKALQVLVSEKVEKVEKKASANVSNYNSISNQLRKTAEQTTIKAVRKTVQPPSTPPPSAMQKKKVSSKKDITSTVIVAASAGSSKASVTKDKIDLAVAKDLRSDISAVDPKESLCHSFMSNMTSFLSEKKSIYLIGGFNQEANNIVKMDPSSLTWEEVAPLQANRSKFGATAIGKQIFVFGGKRGKERVSDAEIYNATSNKWTKIGPLCKNRSGFAVLTVGDLLFFIGGNDGDNILSTVETFNITTGEWRKRESMHEARDELAAVVARNNKIYAIGGFGGKDSEPLRSVQVYDLKTEKWKIVPSMNEPRRALAAAVLADGIYAIGGFDGNQYMSSVQRFDEGDHGWSMVGSMKQARCTHSAVSLFESQEIYVFGGFDYVPLDSVERYNVISNEWEAICTMPSPRFMHASLLLKQE